MKPALLLLALLLPSCVSLKEARAMEKVSYYTGWLEGRMAMHETFKTLLELSDETRRENEALRDARKNCGEVAK